jgi:hypothetical protein
MLYKFIGNSPSDNVPPRNQFVVEVSQEEFEIIRKFPYPPYMKAKLVTLPKNLPFFNTPIGATGVYINPYYEQHFRNWPGWLQVTDNK